MRTTIIVLLLLCAVPTFGQVIQSKVCPVDQQSGFALPCHFDNPVASGDLIVVVETAGDPFGCSVSGCPSVWDNQGDVWKFAVVVPYFDGNPLLYALNAKGGDTTVSFAPGTAQLAIIAEYPPSSGLDSAGYNTYAGQNLDAPTGQSNDESWTWLETQYAGDVIIAWERNGAPFNNHFSPTPGFGFTVRAYTQGAFMLEDMWSSGPGYYYPNVKWENAPGHWVMGAAAFRMK